MAHYYHATFEISQVILEHLQGGDVQIIRRFVQYQEVRVGHQYHAQLQSSTFTTRQLSDIVLLTCWGEEEVIEKLHRSKFLATPKVNSFCHLTHRINHLRIVVERHAFLREVTKLHRFADNKSTRIRFFQPKQQFDESTLTCPISTHDTHLFIAGKVVVEVFQDDDILAFVRVVLKGFRYIFSLKYLRADVFTLHSNSCSTLLNTLLCNSLKFVESLLAIPGLGTSCTWHSTHPVQFLAI